MWTWPSPFGLGINAYLPTKSLTLPHAFFTPQQAIKAALSSLPQESVALRYLLSGAGAITMSDVDLAAASQALLVGFNLEPSDAVLTHAKRLGVNIMTYKVIYEIVDDIKVCEGCGRVWRGVEGCGRV